MFSGIVEEIGTILELSPHHIAIEASKILSDTVVSDSISVSGVCLTVTAAGPGSFRASVMPETLRRSNLGSLTVGDLVNLERAVTPETRLGGHLVLGHVDGVGHIVSIVPEEEARMVSIQAPAEVMRYIAFKGSVAVDGVSLTVARLDSDSFAVSLVPYTSEHTTLGRARPGQIVNLEVDVVARYLERLQQTQPGGGSGITWQFLKQHGY
ncbi:MAG: riboflavin synthase [Dehalococcoidia bacterium]|nr:riboflavin synthase [Dehalococcoidia bacterium]